MNILCIGHAAYDITAPVDHYPIENTKNRIATRNECGGGPASNAAYLLGKWGMDVRFAGMVGNDDYGNRIKNELASVNVNVNYLELNDNNETSSSYIIANKELGTRTIITYHPGDMQMKDVNLDFIPDIILLDGHEPVLSKKLLLMYPNAISIIDAGRATPDVIELSKIVTYLVCSKAFAEEVTEIKIDRNDSATLVSLYKKMEKMFPNKIVITLEANGALYKKDTFIKLMPSLKVVVVDSTGAGDIFHGAFTYGIAKGMDYENIIKIANIAGALSVTKLGGRTSIPTKAEMKASFNEFE